MEITAAAAGGDGIARLDDGQVVFCEGGLPGETVVVDIVERRRDYLRGRVRSVVVPSAVRVDPPCPYVAGGCGGCTWQHVTVEGQLELKVDIARDALRRIARRSDAVVRATGGVALAGYRTGAHLAVDAAGHPAYHRRHSGDLIATESCLVAHPLLAELIETGRFPGATDVRLRVSAATGERLAVSTPPAAMPTVPAGTVVSQPAALHEDVAGRRWRVSAGSFFQSGPAAASALVDAVRAAVGGDAGPGSAVVDLYAGIGLLGGALVASWPGASLVAVESDPSAVADARVNLADLDVRVLRGEVARSSPGPADVVIADPSRTGLGPSAATTAAGIGAPVLILVSCDPASMARDVTLLRDRGYDLVHVDVVDVFPGTFHVETVSRFVRTRATR